MHHVALAVDVRAKAHPDAPVPTTWVRLIYEGYLVAENVASEHGVASACDFRLGPHSYCQIYGVPEEELDALAPETHLDQSWGRLGDVLLTREEVVLRSGDPSVVMGVFLAERWHDPETAQLVVVAFADGDVREILATLGGTQTEDYRKMAARDRGARSAIGASEPPDYLALIQRHTDEMLELVEESRTRRFHEQRRREEIVDGPLFPS